MTEARIQPTYKQLTVADFTKLWGLGTRIDVRGFVAPGAMQKLLSDERAAAAIVAMNNGDLVVVELRWPPNGPIAHTNWWLAQSVDQVRSIIDRGAIGVRSVAGFAVPTIISQRKMTLTVLGGG